MVQKALLAMLIFVPAALLAKYALDTDPILVFILSALGIIPLADFIGEATEELALHTGPKIGGLLNATLGNAAELIITIFAINEGLLDLVRASIAGSIMGNLLLVMGLSLVFGGLKHGVQTFDVRNARMNATLLVLAVVALMVPSLFDVAIAEDKAAEVGLSEGVALVMIILYGLSVFYSFTGGKSPDSHESAAEEVHHARWSVQRSVAVLAVATLGIVFMSELLVGAVESVTEEFGLTELFIGVIVIPLVGNVAEHLVAVQVAYKNKMELSLAVSIGSSLQVALFVAPVLVFISLFFDDTLLLVFNNFEIIALAAASLIAAFVAQDGESNWLEGSMLLGVYVIVGIAFYYLPAAH
ncbi:MAG TPA: calcium/proton exchanger [Aggregatilineales bacterium]|nr:calcium/proton exchanger [Aggregatilineales bacterium]